MMASPAAEGTNMTLIDDWFGGRSRVLFVHAHPDDESIATGGTLAGLAEAGRDPLLVTLTRGERGEVVPGPFTDLQGTARLAPHREQELAAALTMLGVREHAFLGTPPARAEAHPPRVYEDSGMAWGPDGHAVADPGASEAALTRAAAVDPLTDLLVLAHAWGATAVVSYNEIGGYGHPDHVFAHRAARAVAQALEVPFWEIVSAGPSDPPALIAGGSRTESARAESARMEPAGTEPALAATPVIERHDVTAWFERKLAALRCHATQLTVDGTEIVHVGGQRQPIDRIEVFRLLEAKTC